MAEQRVTVTNGIDTWVTTVSEYQAMIAGRPANLPKLSIVGDTPIDSVYENSDGELVRESVDKGQIERRAQFGQPAEATPERIEAHRAQEQRRTVEATADEANITALLNAATPGAQFMQDAAVGKDAAAEARQQLNINLVPGVVGNLAEFALGGKAISTAFKGLLGAERAAKIGTQLGLSKNAGALGRAGQVAATDVAVETHFYVQNLLDRPDGEFVAEDWAQQVGVGLILAGPFIGGAAARGVGAGIRRGLEAAGANIPGTLSTLGDVMTTAAILSPVGAKGAVFARNAAVGHVSGRIMRKVLKRRKGRGLGATDELAEQQAKMLDDMDHVGGLTPERLSRMTPGARKTYLDRFKELADGDVRHLDEVEWGTITKRTAAMNRKVAGIRTQILGIHRRFKGDGSTIKMSQKGRAALMTEANQLLKHVESAGMEDVKGAIQRGIINADGDVGLMHAALFEAKINARFRRGVSGGADVVDDSIGRFLADETVWGARQATKNKKVVAAIDDTVAVWDELGSVQIPKHLEDVKLNDALHLQNTQLSVTRLRQNMNALEEAKLLSRDQVRALETKLVDADEAIVAGTRAYGDVIGVNTARAKASAKLTKEAEVNLDIPSSPESFAANKLEMVTETAKDLLDLGTKGLDAALSTKSQLALTRGVAALHGMSTAEKYEVFAEAQAELPTLTGNPAYAMERMSKFLDRGAAYDPVGADKAGMKMVNTMYWLASQMPKPDDTLYGRQVPQPLSEVEEYLEKHIAAYDPISVAFAALEGRATQGMVDAVRVTAPAMYAEMNTIFAEILSKVPAREANPKVIAGISLFLGNMDPMYTGDFLMRVQAPYLLATSPQGPQQGSGGNIPNQNDPQNARSGVTTSQRQQG